MEFAPHKPVRPTRKFSYSQSGWSISPCRYQDAYITSCTEVGRKTKSDLPQIRRNGGREEQGNDPQCLQASETTKKAVVYNVTEKRFYELKALAHWEEFISQSRAVFVHGFSRSAKVELGDVELMPVKKIFAKFG